MCGNACCDVSAGVYAVEDRRPHQADQSWVFATVQLSGLCTCRKVLRTYRLGQDFAPGFFTLASGFFGEILIRLLTITGKIFIITFVVWMCA